MFYLQLLNDMHHFCSDIVTKPDTMDQDNDSEKQLLTKNDKDDKYGSGYLPGLSWVCLYVHFLCVVALCTY